MRIPITLSDKLVEVLQNKGIKPADYGPAYGGESVGLDLYYTGDETIRKAIPGMLLRTGLRIALPKGYVALVKDRGSISKTSFTRRAGVVDPGYTGEIFVNLIGEGKIEPGDKLPAQLVVVKAETEYHLTSQEDFDILTKSSKRKDAKTGSSDKEEVKDEESSKDTLSTIGEAFDNLADVLLSSLVKDIHR